MSDNNGIFHRLRSAIFGGGHDRDTDRYTMPIQVRSEDFDQLLDRVINRKIDVSTRGKEKEIYKTTSDIGLVVGRKADMFSNGRFKIYDYKTDEEVDIKSNRNALEIIKLLERPNAFQSGAEFLKQFSVYNDIYGNAFIYLNYAYKGAELPSAMYLLPPDLMKVIPTGKIYDQIDIEGIVKRYDMCIADGKFKPYLPKDIIHIKRFNPSNIYVGLSPLEQLGLDIANTRAGKGYLNAVSSKMGAIGALTPDGVRQNDYGAIMPMNEDTKLELEKQFSETTHGIFDKQNKLKISSIPLKFVSFTTAIRDHQILEQLDENKRTIIDTFGMNENIFSKKGGSKYDNLLEGEKQAYTSTLIPQSEILTDAFVNAIKIFESLGFYLKLDYSHVEALKSDKKAEAEILYRKSHAYKLLIDSGMSPNEAKEIIERGDF